jgi:hypothetical protein
MKEIKLTQKQVALVDDENFEYLNQWKWCAAKHKNPKPGIVVDHRNRNGLDNQKHNLRLCTNAKNIRNRTAYGKSKYLGVTPYIRCGKYQYFKAMIYADGKSYYLGNYKSEETAAKAYDTAAAKFFEEFANLNFK